MVEYRSAFGAIRKDPQWKRKLALGVLVSLIPYLGTVWLLGWQLQYQRNVAWGDGGRIPEWSDFAGQALLGLKAFLAVLPYSMAVSAITTPLPMVGTFLFTLRADSDPASAGVLLAIGLVAWFVLLMMLVIAIMPLTGSLMLRVSLYGTLDSGFQLKETWHLMREEKSSLMRAWRFSMLNLGMTYGAMLAFGALVAVLVVLAVSTQSMAALVVGMVVVPPIGFLAVMTLSLYLGLTNMHFFGMYGRVAYRLDTIGEAA